MNGLPKDTRSALPRSIASLADALSKPKLATIAPRVELKYDGRSPGHVRFPGALECPLVGRPQPAWVACRWQHLLGSATSGTEEPVPSLLMALCGRERH
jgi:hypothetical protein